MSDKKIISKEEIAALLDDDNITVASMDELVEAIKKDPNAKRALRKFLGSAAYEFCDAESRLAYLKENYYIEGCDDNIGSVQSDDSNESANVNEKYAENTADFEKIVSEMESKEFETIIPESENTFSSVEVKLTETTVIETGKLKITWKNPASLDLSKMLIMEKSGNRVLAVGHMFEAEGSSNKFWGVFDDRNMILYDRFEGQNQVRLVVYTQDGTAHSCIAEMAYRKMEIEKDKPLCIDFGTSNTTVGTYGIRTDNDVETVKFVDVTVEPHNTNANMLPTVVYVDDCSDADNIKYLFGYEALKRIEQEKHYEFRASAFFEIKRWMTSPFSKEELRDNNNNKVIIERKYIIKAYIDYVIKSSEQFFGRRFEKIHFSAPVKLKRLFINTFKELYKDEKIVLGESECIDEAFAIVYNQIINIIDDKKESMENKSVLIVDCGGGTTDLANCTFSYTKNENYTDVLEYTTRFENGNPNFGGNNITYRVMQLLKIKIASGFNNSIRKDATHLIKKTEDEILNTIEHIADKKKAYNSDECSDEIYKEFVDEYNKCESVIPTKFSKDLDLDSYELMCRKRNFYCMWRLAEKIKIEFFNTLKVQFNFCDQDIKELRVDSANSYFYVIEGDDLVKKMNPLKDVTITNKDIERIICGDIYSLLYSLLKNGDLSDDKNVERKVENFDYYKLSGQSCKISMFKELLKEYIPGRKLRPYSFSNKTEITDNKSENLKLECLHGCIKYIKDQRGHELNIIPHNEPAKVIYNIFIINEHNNDEQIFDCTDLTSENTIFKLFDHNANEMIFEVRNKDGAAEKSFRMSLDDKYKLKASSAEDLLEVITENCSYENDYIIKVIQTMCDKLDNNHNNDCTKVLFCLPSPDYYGSTIFLVQHENNNGNSLYKLLYCMDVSFENPDKTFFDGKR